MKKLAPRWIGPYVLGRQISELTFDILKLPEKISIGKRHVSQLKPYTLRREETMALLKSPTVLLDGTISKETNDSKPQNKKWTRPLLGTNVSQNSSRVLRQRPQVDYKQLASRGITKN